MNSLRFLWLLLATVIGLIAAHGTVHEPVARQTRWRQTNRPPRNYNDNELWCGGYNVQWHQNGGRCGLCGDNFADPLPREHELGGRFGAAGTIVRTYAAGAVMPVRVQLTANHLGHFVFDLCSLRAGGQQQQETETEACFAAHPLRLENGAERFVLPPSQQNGWFDLRVRLPAGLRCEHCVLRWTYVAGHNWGICADGSGRLGCGPQEHFRACSDVRVN